MCKIRISTEIISSILKAYESSFQKSSDLRQSLNRRLGDPLLLNIQLSEDIRSFRLQSMRELHTERGHLELTLQERDLGCER